MKLSNKIEEGLKGNDTVISRIIEINEKEQSLHVTEINRLAYLSSLMRYLEEHPETIEEMHALGFFTGERTFATFLQRWHQICDTLLHDTNVTREYLDHMYILEDNLKIVRDRALIETEAQLSIGKEILLTRGKIGLALGGGGLWGFSHIGVLDELQKKGIPVHLLAGVSFGALIGGIISTYIDEKGNISPEGTDFLQQVALNIKTLSQLTTKDEKGNTILSLEDIIGREKYRELIGKPVHIPIFIQAELVNSKKKKKDGKNLPKHRLMLSVPDGNITYGSLEQVIRASSALKPKFGISPVTIDQQLVVEFEDMKTIIEGGTFRDDKSTAVRSVKDEIQQLKKHGADLIISVPVAFSDSDVIPWRQIKSMMKTTQGSIPIEPKNLSSGFFGLALTNWALRGERFADTQEQISSGERIPIATEQFIEAGRNATKTATPQIYAALGLIPLRNKIIENK